MVHRLGFPSALEALRAGSSHIPSQVGQVAGFLAKAWCGIFRANPVWVLLFYLLAQKDSEARHFPAVPAWPARGSSWGPQGFCLLQWGTWAVHFHGEVLVQPWLYWDVEKREQEDKGIFVWQPHFFL